MNAHSGMATTAAAAHPGIFLRVSAAMASGRLGGAAPPPRRPEVIAAESRKKIPWWAATALVAMPLWAFLFAYTLEPPTAGVQPRSQRRRGDLQHQLRQLPRPVGRGRQRPGVRRRRRRRDLLELRGPRPVGHPREQRLVGGGGEHLRRPRQAGPGLQRQPDAVLRRQPQRGGDPRGRARPAGDRLRLRLRTGSWPRRPKRSAPRGPRPKPLPPTPLPRGAGVDRHDVLVVGGGPAGAATAYWLAEAGHDVVIVEKKRFPREKTCGDGLTPRAVKQLTDMGLAGRLDRLPPLRRAAGGRPRHHPRARSGPSTPTSRATASWCAGATSTRWSPSAR